MAYFVTDHCEISLAAKRMQFYHFHCLAKWYYVLCAWRGMMQEGELRIVLSSDQLPGDTPL